MARFRAAFDGGSRGNPGPAAWGVAILDDEGQCVEGHGGFIGRATNNVAEYTGLLEALALAEAAGADQVQIRADSELIVKQIRGIYKVRNEGLKPLFLEAKRRIARFALFEIEHVRRERNKDADRMANVALDQAEADGATEPFRVREDCQPHAE